MPSPEVVEFLRTANTRTRQDFALARLNLADRLEKHRRALEAQIIDARTDAGLARLFDEDEKLGGMGGHPLQEVLDFTESPGVGAPPLKSDAERFPRGRAANY